MHPTAAKVQERLRERGLDVTVVVLPDSARTAVEAAAAVGCEAGQIVKSLVHSATLGALAASLDATRMHIVHCAARPANSARSEYQAAVRSFLADVRVVRAR